MPSLKLSNPFRRGADRRSLKQRAAGLKATAARLMGRKAAAEPADSDPFGMEGAASLSFDAFTIDRPFCSLEGWQDDLNSQAIGLVLAERLLRMNKAEMYAFLCEAGERDAATPELMFRTLSEAQDALDGWGKLINVAVARFIIAASSEDAEVAAAS